MSFSIIELMLDHAGYKCGYCGQKDTAHSQGMWSHKLNAIDYQDMIDRGWRRSGKYCYKPVMNKTCCPQYTIRCRSLEFKLTKSKKKVLNRMKQFLINGDVDEEIEKWRKKQQSSVTESSGDISTKDDMPQISEEIPQTASVLPVKDFHDTNNVSHTPVTTSNNVDKKVTPTPGVGADPTKSPCKKSKEIRREKLLKKVDKTSNSSEPSKKQQSQPKPLEDYIPHLLKLPEEARNRLEVRTVRASLDNPAFLSTKAESHTVYKKYQSTIHKDDEDDCNEAQWLRFLVHSPINLEGKNPTYGLYHQHYVLNDRIIAVGVVDVLSRCASSVYLYYDPDFGFLSLGVYSALSEVAYSRHLHTLESKIEYYYMGFYIHSCQKMQYKGKYEPSELLCPETYNWVPISNCVEALKKNKYCRLNELNGGLPDAVDVGSANISLSDVGILYNRTLYRFNRYVIDKYFRNGLVAADPDNINGDQERVMQIKDMLKKDELEIKEYVTLVGMECANRMFIYRSMLLDLDDDE